MSQPSILTYHSLDDSGSVISIPGPTFRRQVQILKQRGIPVARLEEISSRPGSLALTFDDGFGNFYTEAFPILSEYGFPATVFVVSGYCGGENNWPTQPRTGIPILPLMDWSRLKEISRYGIRLGAHTVTHPRLSELNPGAVVEEMRRSREEIEQRIGSPVETFAYPYGDCSGTTIQLARDHFRFACGTSLAGVTPTSDPACLPRLDAFYFQRNFWFESIGRWHGRAYVEVRGALRRVRQSIPIPKS